MSTSSSNSLTPFLLTRPRTIRPNYPKPALRRPDKRKLTRTPLPREITRGVKLNDAEVHATQRLIDLVHVPVAAAVDIIQDVVRPLRRWALCEEERGGGSAVDGGLEVVEILQRFSDLMTVQWSKIDIPKPQSPSPQLQTLSPLLATRRSVPATARLPHYPTVLDLDGR